MSLASQQAVPVSFPNASRRWPAPSSVSHLLGSLRGGESVSLANILGPRNPSVSSILHTLQEHTSLDPKQPLRDPIYLALVTFYTLVTGILPMKPLAAGYPALVIRLRAAEPHLYRDFLGTESRLKRRGPIHKVRPIPLRTTV